MSFTPGPWKVRKTFYGETYIEGKDGYYVCAFPVCYPNKNDVVMIAAAPEMLEFLRQAADELHAIGCGKDPADGLELSEHIAAFLLDLDGEEPTDD